MKARILLVDDATALLKVLRAFFTSEGYDVVGELTAAGGVLDAIAQLKPDIVCLDYHLPDVNGIELLKMIRATYSDVTVVMITSDRASEVETEAAEAGAIGFIRKPFTQERLAIEMRQALYAQELYVRHSKGKLSTPLVTIARAVVVDDSTTMRKLLSAILQHTGVEVVGEAADGKQAIEVVERCQPEIVCLDLDMPVMNGLNALDRIHAAHPQIRVLMISGCTETEVAEQAVKRGACGFLLKPFDPNKVAEAVRNLLGT